MMNEGYEKPMITVISIEPDERIMTTGFGVSPNPGSEDESGDVLSGSGESGSSLKCLDN